MSEQDTDTLELIRAQNDRAKRRAYITVLLLVSAALLCAWQFRTPWDIYRTIGGPVFILVLLSLAVVIWREWLPLGRVETLLLVMVSALPLSRQIWVYLSAGVPTEQWLRLLGNAYWATSGVLVLLFTIGDRRRGLITGTVIVAISIVIAVIGVGTGVARGDLPSSTIVYVVGSLLFIILFLLMMSVATIMRDQWHTAISDAAVYSHWAMTDKLTGLANRRAGVDVLARSCAAARRHDRPLSIIMGDLDGFKEVNDTAGHAVGDVVLRGMAEILRTTVRQSDVVVRWGGDEFLIIAVDSQLEDARILARRCQRAIEAEPIAGLRVSMAVGVAQYRQGDTEESLIVRADENLYRDKKASKQQVEV